MFKSTNTQSGLSLSSPLLNHFSNFFAASSELFNAVKDKLMSSNEQASSNTKWNKSSSSTNKIESIIFSFFVFYFIFIFIFVPISFFSQVILNLCSSKIATQIFNPKPVPDSVCPSFLTYGLRR